MEKPWYRSKKFIAFIIVEVFMCAMAIVALFKQPELGWPLATFMVGIVFVMGFCAAWFIGSQAAVDKFVLGAAFMGKSLTAKFSGSSDG